MSLSRRQFLAAAAGPPAAICLGASLSSCTTAPRPDAPPSPGRPGGPGSASSPGSPTAGEHARIGDFALGPPVGDGSTSVARPQPHQPEVHRLEPGERPPQFVVFSWDGSSALAPDNLARFRRVAARNHAAMTFFLTGIYLVPESRRRVYDPPGHKRGASAISFMSADTVHRTIKEVGEAWVEGNEIGTHFNGHFCGRGGAATWSRGEWRQELDEVEKFVTRWRTITGFDDLPPLPFEFSDIVGGRTPCLEGRRRLLPVARSLGWRYDSSGTRSATWPARDRYGLWNLSMHPVPFGRHRSILPMDYNFLVNQHGGDTAKNRRRWRHQVEGSLLSGLEQSLHGNRAPLIIGNHFSPWRHGIYLDAIENTIDRFAGIGGVRLVSFRQLVDWLDAQDRSVLRRLQRLPGRF